MRRLSIAILAGGLAAAGLSGCGQQAASDPKDPNAGLSEAILAWRADIDKSKECSAKPAAGGKACQTYEVGCKVEQPIGPQDKGVTAKVLAAMSWSAWNPKRNDYDPASSGAVFSKVNGKWVRKDVTGPVNLTTCATS